jgi:ribosomal protein S14
MNLGKTPDVGVVQLTGELQIILAELAEYDKHYQPGVATGGQQRCSGCGTPLTQEQDFGMGLCRLCDTLEGEE